MGIRLVCPQGHKLHVKAFLAGKRAICPHCGEKVLVPLGNDAQVSAGDSLHSESPRGKSPHGESQPTESPFSLETTIDLADMPATLPSGVTAASPVKTVPGQAAPAIVPATAAIPATQPSPQTPTSTATHAAIGIPPMAPTTPAATGDPIADNPGAVWYVRPKTGGQFGPAPGNMMRQWIAESRVAGDSLVWREGWAQWTTASEVFVELGASSAPSSVTAPMPVGGARWPSENRRPIGGRDCAGRRRSDNARRAILCEAPIDRTTRRADRRAGTVGDSVGSRVGVCRAKQNLSPNEDVGGTP